MRNNATMQRCSKGRHITMLLNLIGYNSIEGMGMWKHKVQLLPYNGLKKYCVGYILRWGCAQHVGIIWPSYYARPEGPKCMRRVNTFKKWMYHTRENLDFANVRRCWCTHNCWCTQLIQIKENNKSRQIHITYGRRDMATPYLRGIGRYPNSPVSMLFNDNDHFKKKNQLF